jgi:drug/metabolite transporter (DMT)-like permease
MHVQQKHWFPAKRHGWGWGLPIAWQGWGVLAVFFCLLLGGAVVLLPHRSTASFVVYSALLCVLLVAVFWLKGERPRWRWGGQ